jgi:uroporphyrinogen-III synthase
MEPTVLVTRPSPEAERWVDALRQRGIAAEALPLMVIAPLGQTPELARVWAGLASYAAVMFVSPNAARCFFESNSPLALHQEALIAMKTRAWSPGPGTTQTLREAGWPVERLDQPAADAPQFDSESLWAQVGCQVQPGQRILIVRGGDAEGRPSGREWLADQLRAAGAEVDEVAAYRRAPPAAEGLWTARAAAGAQDRSVWLFSSSEAVANLCQCMPQQRWQQARALATHPRIAEAARSAGFGSVTMVRPMLDAVAASIKSLHDT